MTCKYTLNEKVIFMDICARFLEPGKKICYINNSSNGAYLPSSFVTVLIDLETSRPYFEIDDEQKYFDEYDYLPLDEFIKKIHRGALQSGEITYQDFLATLSKENTKIGFVFSADDQEMPIRIFCPIETEKTAKSDWGNKITLESLTTLLVGDTSDLFKALCNGSVKLVNKNQPSEKNSLGETLKRLLGNRKRKPR